MRPSFFVALLLMAAAPAALAAPFAGQVIAKDGVEVTVMPWATPASAPGPLVQVALDIEGRTDDAAKRLGARSLRVLASIDCSQSADRLMEAQAYAQADLKGAAAARTVNPDWVSPAADSYMRAVVERVCSADRAAPAGPAPVVTAASLTPPAPAQQPEPQPAPAPAAPAVTPTPPPAAPAAASAATVKPPAPPPAAAAVVAQVAASPTAKGAQRVLTALKLAPPLTGTVEPAQVDGAQVYRASVSGFASMAEARAFCLQAASVSKTCWVRRPPPHGAAATKP